MQERRTFMDRREVAQHWFREEYEPVTEMLRSGDLVGEDETETEGYMRLANDRYRVLRTHDWSDAILDDLRHSDIRARRRRRVPPRRLRRRR
jgi:hypothetical protein